VFSDGNPETQLLKQVKTASGSPTFSAHNIPQSWNLPNIIKTRHFIIYPESENHQWKCLASRDLMYTHNYQSGTSAGTENMEPLAFDVERQHLFTFKTINYIPKRNLWIVTKYKSACTKVNKVLVHGILHVLSRMINDLPHVFQCFGRKLDTDHQYVYRSDVTCRLTLWQIWLKFNSTPNLQCHAVFQRWFTWDATYVIESMNICDVQRH